MSATLFYIALNETVIDKIKSGSITSKSWTIYEYASDIVKKASSRSPKKWKFILV